MIITRRTFVKAAAASGAAFALPGIAPGATHAPVMRTVPSSGEAIPAVGLGTWITFNVGDDPVLRDECADVIAAFFEAGGRMIDSSPMYGSSQPVVGYGLEKLGRPEALFSAEKVWTSSAADGPAQIEQSRRFWGVPRFDLVQVHNLVGLGSASRDPVRHEGGRADPLCRHHHLRRTPARSVRRDHAAPSARLRATHLQHRRPRGGGAAAAARGRARHGGDRQPALPAGRTDAAAGRRATARLGGGDRRRRPGRSSS